MTRSRRALSAFDRITDSSRTSRDVRFVPKSRPTNVAKRKSRPKAASQFKPNDRGSGGHHGWVRASRSLLLPAPSEQSKRAEASGVEWESGGKRGRTNRRADALR